MPAPLCSHGDESVNLSQTELRNKIVVCSVAFVQGKHLGSNMTTLSLGKTSSTCSLPVFIAHSFARI